MWTERPVRIVSLIPEATEILAALGLGDDVVAVPDEDAQDVERLASFLRLVQPSLIFTSETSAGGGLGRQQVRRAVAQVARKPRPAVYALEPRSVGEILGDVKTVGDAVGRQGAARSLIERLRARIDAVSLRSARAIAEVGTRRVACLHGVDPPIAAGWWLAELVGLAGGLDVLDGLGRPPRAVRWEEIRAAQPAIVVVVGSQPGNVGAVDAGEADMSAVDAPMSIAPAFIAPTGGELYPGPGVVDVLEQLLALILHIGQDLSASPDIQV